MKFSVATVLAVAGIAAAVPLAEPQYGRPSSAPTSASSYNPYSGGPPAASSPAPSCLTSADATSLVNSFQSLISNYTLATAEKVLTSDFTDTSDSINMMAGYPLGSTTFPSKAAFEAGQGSQQAVPMSILAIDSVACTSVGFRWAITVNPSKPVVKGINSMITSYNSTQKAWQIKQMFSEFNNCQWINLIGGTCKGPGQ